MPTKSSRRAILAVARSEEEIFPAGRRLIRLHDADALPVPSRRRKRQRKPNDRPMTQEERDALEFEAIKVEFNWSNDEWAALWLPWVRVAAIYVRGDQDKLKELMADLVKEGNAPNLLEGLTRTKLHLEALYDLVQAALMRSFLMIERLGYSPDNPPPESRVN
jgi:hypothetical protein